jgi:hypothetical protein
MAAAVATMLMSSASLEGAMVTMWGRLAMKVMSKAPQWVAPSAPTMPARSMAKRTAGDRPQRMSAWGQRPGQLSRQHLPCWLACCSTRISVSVLSSCGSSLTMHSTCV